MGATVFGGGSGVLMHISDTCAIRFFDLQTWLTVKRIQLWIPFQKKGNTKDKGKERACRMEGILAAMMSGLTYL